MTSDPNRLPDDPTLPADAAASEPRSGQSDSPGDGSPPSGRQRILIGSQRDTVKNPEPRRDWYVPGEEPKPAAEPTKAEAEPAAVSPEASAKTTESDSPVIPYIPELDDEEEEDEVFPSAPVSASGVKKHFPPPNIRGQLSPELEAELEDALGSASLDDLLAGQEGVTAQPQLEAESKQAGRVVALSREDVFVELGGREQGSVSLRLFTEPPSVGDMLEVVVHRYNADDGIYELTLPHATTQVGDWSDLSDGVLVDVVVTGHNSGGLECEVNHLRGFIPVSQVSLYRVEDLSDFVNQRFTCLVTEANPERRNLVLSRRAVLEMEQEEARKDLLKSLSPGQVREGVVRKIMDFGAFVDIGGVDGLLHISQLGWNRVNHPSDVLTEGQTIKVQVQKYDPQTRRISLGYRDLMESPWTGVDRKYPVNSVFSGKVSKLMEFGAFVELEPGIEGLVHISELSHKRVWRTSDVVKEGEEVQVMVKSVDVSAQRIGLSIKDVLPVPEDQKKAKPEDQVGELPAAPKKAVPKVLKGGLGRGAGGDQFGLKW